MIHLLCFPWCGLAGGTTCQSCINMCACMHIASRSHFGSPASVCINWLSLQSPHPWRFVMGMVGTATGPTAGENLARAAHAGGRLRTLVIQRRCFARPALRRVRIKRLRQIQSGTMQRAELSTAERDPGFKKCNATSRWICIDLSMRCRRGRRRCHFLVVARLQVFLVFQRSPARIAQRPLQQR